MPSATVSYSQTITGGRQSFIPHKQWLYQLGITVKTNSPAVILPSLYYSGLDIEGFSQFFKDLFRFRSVGFLIAIPPFIISNNRAIMISQKWRSSWVPWSLLLGCHNTHQLTCRKFLICQGNPRVSRSDLCLAPITDLHCDVRSEILDSGETGPGRWVKHEQPRPVLQHKSSFL